MPSKKREWWGKKRKQRQVSPFKEADINNDKQHDKRCWSGESVSKCYDTQVNYFQGLGHRNSFNFVFQESDLYCRVHGLEKQNASPVSKAVSCFDIGYGVHGELRAVID